MAWGTNRREPVKHPPVMLECPACGHLGCECKVAEHPEWFVEVTCPVCGHVEMRCPRPVPGLQSHEARS